MHTRIEAIGQMVKKGRVTADIGTDHALLPVYLIRNNITDRVYACDIGEGPLLQAEKTIRKYGMQNRIIPVLSDGFENVPEDTECAVIAGMGFQTASSILENGLKCISHYDQIITEIHGRQAAADMRRWISHHDFSINRECFLEEGGHGYMIISFEPGKRSEMSDLDIVIGPYMRQHPDEKYISWLADRQEKINRIISQAGKHHPDEKVLSEKKQIDEYLKRRTSEN